MPHSTQFISQILVNGQLYDIVSQYDNPVHFEGIVADTSGWTGDVVTKTGDISVKVDDTSTRAFTPQPGCMVLAGTREYVCTQYVTSSLESTWHLMGYVEKHTADIDAVNTAQTYTGSILTAVSTGTAPVVTEVTTNDTSVIVSVTPETKSVVVITADPGEANFSEVTTKAQQVVTAFTTDSVNPITEVTITAGGVEDKMGTVITQITGNHTAHKEGTIVTNVTQSDFVPKTGKIVESVELPTLTTQLNTFVSRIDNTLVTSTVIPVVTSVGHVGIALSSAAAITKATVTAAADSVATALTAVSEVGKITPTTGQVVTSYEKENLDPKSYAFVTGVSIAASTSAPFVSSVTMPVVTNKAEQEVISSVSGGSFVTGTSSASAIAVISQHPSSSTPSSSLFSVADHILTLTSDVTLVTAVGTVSASSHISAITAVNTAAISLGKVSVVKSFELTPGDTSTASAVTAVGALSSGSASAVTAVNWTPSTFATGAVNTKYDYTAPTFSTHAFVTESGKRGLDVSTGTFATGVSDQGTVSVNTANVIDTMTFNESAIGKTTATSVKTWTSGGVTGTNITTSFTGGTITTHDGTIVTAVESDTLTAVTGEVVTSTSYTSQTLNTKAAGVITYLNGATLTTVDVVSSLATRSAVTSVPRASQTVVTDVTTGTVKVLTGVGTKTGNFLNTLTTTAGAVVTTIPTKRFTVVTDINS